MDLMEEEDNSPFVLFTRESLFNIQQNIAELKAIKKADKQAAEEGEEEELPHHEEEAKPNPKFEVGKKLPRSLLDDFPPNYVGKPIEDLDEYYDSQMTFCVIGKDKTIYRFSATNALFILNPFNPIRRGALYLLVHPLFNALVIITIIVNCVFMAMQENKEYGDIIEYVFTGIYTVEAVVKITARGFILKPFTYLRDMWNWLDFTVIALAYITMVLPKDVIGNLAAIRTFRVLRALKTVAVVPGLKTIVGALLEAVRRLRDVIILSIFMLSIFALIGMQLYTGTLRQKCIKIPDDNLTDEELIAWNFDEANWQMKDADEYVMCGPGAGKCLVNYTCINGTRTNPNYNYTHYDNFGVALLLSFRLMTQDYWENLYMLILRAEGPFHCIYFMIVILLGSFYLVNLILAIVAMSYNETQKQDLAEAKEEECEKMLEKDRHERERQDLLDQVEEMLTKSPSDGTNSIQGEQVDDEVSVKSEKPSAVESHPHLSKPSLSLPGSPFFRRNSSKMKYSKHAPPSHPDHQPLVPPFLDIRNLPYADDSNAVTPNSDDLCTLPIYNKHLTPRRSSFASIGRRSHGDRASSRRSSFASLISRASIRSQGRSPRDKTSVLLYNFALAKKKHPHLLPDVVVDKTKFDENESSVGSDFDGEKKKGGHNAVCRTSSGRNVDVNDVKVIKELLEHASSHRPSVFSNGSFYEDEKLIQRCRRIFCSWTCCPAYLTFQKIVGLFILDAFVDLFITICILINTVFMAMDHYNMSREMQQTLETGNLVFTGIFAAEAFLKIIALNPLQYLKDGWNCFDITIVMLSFIEKAMEGVQGLSVLRSFRLLRVFKLARSWPTLNMLISVVANTLSALGNLVIVLAIVIFIFAVMGQQLFGQSYNEYGNPNQTDPKLRNADEPRWHFKDFLHSFMIVFRVLCGEWIESMWGCQRVSGWPCVPFFLLTYVIGNLVVLNLFLALLLSSFSSDRVTTSDAEPNKLAEAFSRFDRFFRWVKVNVIVLAKRIKSRFFRVPKPTALQPSSPDLSRPEMNGKDSVADGHPVIGNGSLDTHQNIEEHPKLTQTDTVTVEITTGATPDGAPEGDNTSTKSVSRASSIKSSKQSDSCSTSSDDEDSKISIKRVDATGEPEINDVEAVFSTLPDDCFCSIFRQKMPCCIKLENTTIGKKWWALRCKAFLFVEHKYFEFFIITMILASSLALAFEDIYLSQNPILVEVLNYFDKFFTTIFIIEMLLKWVAFGFKKYFTNAWCWLDFIIVSISIIMLIIDNLTSGSGEGENVGSLKALRTLRALRPLRAVSRWEGMRVVVNALIKAIPSIANVLLVCLVFWLIFGIVGVQLFMGKFHKCVDGNLTKLAVSETPNKTVCLAKGHEWINSDINFDHVLNAYLALFQVATYKGWMGIMYDAVDMPDKIDDQPERERNRYMYLYFVLFIIFGSFFTLNLFIGVIIENFNNQKKKAGGSLEMLMTEDQKKYYKAMKRLANKQPQKSIPRPDFWLMGKLYDLITNQAFDIGIMIIIMLNMLTMTLEHYGQSQLFSNVLYYLNLSFIVIFTTECVIKLLALRWYYFKIPWNVFDFVVVVLSILGVAVADAMEHLLIPPTLLRVVRVFRVGRVLRLVKSAKGIRTLLFSLAVSLPALFNIGLLLFLVMFIYATFGMNFFMNVKLTNGLDDMFNFQTFGRSIIMLFMMCTSAGWDGTLAGIMNEKDCSKTGAIKDCGSYAMAVFYLVSYLLISFLVVVNMYIAVILENFSQATEDVQQGLTPMDYDIFYEKWEKYDPNATQFIPLDKLSDFVDYLEDPLRLPKPNHFMLVKLDIPICEGDKVFCTDILKLLTKNFLGTENVDNVEMGDQLKPKAKVEYHVISTTMRRQVMNYAARIIQNGWRKYHREKLNKQPPPPSYKEVTEKETQEDLPDHDIEIVISPSENKTVELGPDSDVVA